MADNTLVLKLDKETTLPLLEGLGKSAYAIAVAHGFKGDEQSWLDSLRGPKGDQGSAEETAQILKKDGEFLKNAKGPKGDPGSAERSAQFLKEKGIYLEDASVDTVLMKVIQLSNCYSNFVPKDLEFVQPKAGATYIDFTGEPHYKIAINNGEKREFQSDNMRVAIDSTMQGNIKVDYYGLTDNIIGTYVINLAVKNEEYDWGALVEAKEISERETKAILQKYENGMKIIVTKFGDNIPPININRTYEAMLSTNKLNSIKTLELDLTKLPIANNKGYWNGSDTVLDAFTYQNNIMLKVKKEQIVTPSDTPFNPTTYGTAENISVGNNTKLTDVKVQINDSNTVIMRGNSYDNYRYSFATNRIEKIN